jgi:competence protein ComEA
MGESGKPQWLVYAAAAVLLVIAGFRFLGGGDDSGREPRVALDGGPASSVQNGGGPRPPGRELYVHVAGAVRRPGLYRVAAGSRAAAAVDRAGGPTRRAELGAVNLAAPLQDGQQVVVPVRGKGGTAPAGATGAGGPAPGNAPATPISLSSATPEQLDGLDGIGPKLAARIIAYRQQHGGFRSVDQLRAIEGIGEKRFEALRKAVTP